MNTRTPIARRAAVIRPFSGLTSRSAGVSACLVACLAVAPVVVQAGPGQADRSESVSTTVSLDNLDLASPSGLAAARERIASAAKRLCARFSDERRADDHQTLIDCYHDAVRLSQPGLNAAVAAARSERAQVARNMP